MGKKLNFRSYLEAEPLVKWQKAHVLNSQKLLTGQSLPNILKIMQKESIDEFFSDTSDFVLKSNGDFSNSFSSEARMGNISKLIKTGNIFRKQNRHLNPFFTKTVASHPVKSKIADLRIKVADIMKDLEILEKQFD
jgi:hypothetical protein